MKTCTKCNQDKELDDFYTYKKAGKIRPTARCKICLRQDLKAAAAKDPQSRREKSRKWYQENTKYVRDQQLQKKYGISLEKFEEMVASQGGKCSICLVDGGAINVDHNHETGQVRALLCHNCNRGLGLFKDSPAVLALAKAYLEKFGSLE